MLLALDGLSGWFLLLVGLAALATCAAAQEEGTSRVRLLPMPLLVLGATLAVTAADGATLLLGFEVLLLAAWSRTAAERDGQEASDRDGVARRHLLTIVLAGACLLAALAIWGNGGPNLSFTALRAAPPEGWCAVLVPVLLVIGTVAGSGLIAPLGPLRAALTQAPTGTVALYVLARLLLDLGAPASSWWAMPLMVIGATVAATGALRSALSDDSWGVLSATTAAHAGLLLVALGLVPLFRAADLGPLAALAAAAFLLHALARSLAGGALLLVAGAAERAAGSASLDRLGGLIRPMPLAAASAALGLLGVACLPPGLGFASGWLLLQSLLAAWRTGEVGVQVVAAAALAAAACALTLGAVAAVRWFGLVFLGRPRGPRAAGAADADGPTLVGMATLAALVVALGVLPGPLLRLAESATRALSGAAMEERAGVLSLAVSDGMGRYLPLAAALLLLGSGSALFATVRRCSPRPSIRGAAWDGGLPAPPAHLPFGDPIAQPSAAGLAQPLRRALGMWTFEGAPETTRVTGATHLAMMLRGGLRMRARGAPGPQDFGAALAVLLLLLLVLAR